MSVGTGENVLVSVASDAVNMRMTVILVADARISAASFLQFN
jgi:O-glycosyl hydrolase